MINEIEPKTWKDLQAQVAQILSEAGVQSEVERVVKNARGQAEIDVWAQDSRSVPTQTYLVECKYWTTPVSQTVVHAFRTVVGDSGANWGAIVSRNGFQSGAYQAAEYSNVRLLTWLEFQEMFSKPWLANFFGPQVRKHCDALVEYTEPINSRIFRKADLLSCDQRQRFNDLREQHQNLGSFCTFIIAFHLGATRIFSLQDFPFPVPEPPLRKSLAGEALDKLGSLSSGILDACSYRELLDALVSEAKLAIEDFDAVFGERA